MSDLYVVELLLPSGKPFRRSKPMSMADAEEMQSQLGFYPSKIVPHQSKDAVAVDTSTPADDRRGARGAMKND